MNVDICATGISNQLFMIGSYPPFQFSKELWQNFFVIDPFCAFILFILILAFDKAILYGNVALSIIVLSTIKRYSSFLKMVLVFLKTCFNVKVLMLEPPVIVT